MTPKQMERMENGPPPKPSRLSMGNMIDDPSAPPVLPQKKKQHTGAEPAEQKPTATVSFENDSFLAIHVDLRISRLHLELLLKFLSVYRGQCGHFDSHIQVRNRPLNYPTKELESNNTLDIL